MDFLAYSNNINRNWRYCCILHFVGFQVARGKSRQFAFRKYDFFNITISAYYLFSDKMRHRLILSQSETKATPTQVPPSFVYTAFIYAIDIKGGEILLSAIIIWSFRIVSIVFVLYGFCLIKAYLTMEAAEPESLRARVRFLILSIVLCVLSFVVDISCLLG